MKFRKRPVIVDAMQFDGTFLLPGMDWDIGGAFVRTIHNNQICYVTTGDWIIPELDGTHFYPVKPDIFEKTYQPVDESDGSDREMEEFAEWIAYKSYSMGNIGRWDKTWHIDDGDEFTGTEKVFTTSELLKLFRQSKPNPQP